MMTRTNWLLMGMIVLTLGASVAAQTGEGNPNTSGPTSSLFVVPTQYERPTTWRSGEVIDTLSPAIKGASLVAVKLPDPREFSLHELVTIIVREEATNSSSGSLETEKSAELDAAIEAFIDLSALLEARVRPSALAGGTPQVKTSFDRKFEGEGDYARKDSMATRITAEVIDIKPNGNLVLEARKFIRTDKETLSIILTGTCRARDIHADNTILSTQLHDLRVVKEHQGEVRNATKKGLITKVLEALFAF